MSSKLARIVVAGDMALVFSPFDAKDLIKSMPVRSWSPTRKCWTIPASDVPDLQELLEAQDYLVVVINQAPKAESPPPPRQGQTPADWARRRGAASDWAAQLFEAVGPDLTPRVHRALARVLHPDAGGSTELMQRVNVAAERMTGR